MSPSRMSLGARIGRLVSLGLTVIAVGWVVAVSVAIVADDSRTATLLVVLVQAVVALAIQAYVLRRVATAWATLSLSRRVGLTVLGVVVAPVELGLGIVGAAVAAGIWLVLGLARAVGRGATRPAGGRATGSARPAGAGGTSPDSSAPGGGWTPRPASPTPRPVCSLCNGRRSVQEYRPNPYPNAGESLQTVTCPSCNGSGEQGY